ncbi:MAG: 6-phosphogluconolactonase [Chloroflexota bacterium]
MAAQVQIFADAAALSEAAAALFVTEAQTAVSNHQRFLVTLSGGTTPAAMFRLLATPPLANQVPWPHVHLFWGDERLVPPDDPGSNYGQAHELLLRHVPIPPQNIHRAKGELSPAAAVADYKAQLAAMAENGRFFPRFDLAIMGLGSDGHTASLFPGPIREEEQTEAVMAVTAVYEDRPAHRLTLTPLLFNDAHHVLFLVAGKSKAAAVTAVLHDPHAPETWPAQRIQPTDGIVSWYLDQPVASNQ